MNRIFILLLFSTTIVHFQEQEKIEHEGINHGVGIEAGGSLLSYSLFYEFNYSWKKSVVGFAIPVNSFGLSRVGIGGRLFYQCGTKHSVRFSGGFGSLINFAAINGKFDDYLPHDRPSEYFNISNFSIGYNLCFGKNSNWNFFANGAINMIDFKELEVSGDPIKQKNYLPFGEIGLKYFFRKRLE